jgi:hypothetical protein
MSPARIGSSANMTAARIPEYRQFTMPAYGSVPVKSKVSWSPRLVRVSAILCRLRSPMGRQSPPTAFPAWSDW